VLVNGRVVGLEGSLNQPSLSSTSPPPFLPSSFETYLFGGRLLDGGGGRHGDKEEDEEDDKTALMCVL
jgi:hypothetical protein